MSAAPFRLRVLSYNIHKGFATGNRRFVLATMREAIREVNADLVFLQEVLGEQRAHAKRFPEWPSQGQFEYLADSVWRYHAYGQNAVYDAGHHGNAILSKFPITSWVNHDVSTNEWEKRGVLHATISVPPLDNDLHCLCVHLGLTRKGRRTQLEKICKRVESDIIHTEPLLMAGDFNDWPRAASRVLHRIGIEEVFRRTKGRYAATFPSALPMLHLDRVYHRGLQVVQAKTLRGKLWRKLSDHVALLVEFGSAR